MSPLAKRDIDVSPNVSTKFGADNKAQITVDMLIDAKSLHFEQSGGRYQTTLDVVGFLFDQMGHRKGGLSQTINLNLTPEEYQSTMTDGFPYSANLELPAGSYQVRCAVREESSGSLGTFSKYLEIPDLTKGRLAMSSIFLFAINSADAKPTQLGASRVLTRTQELRYAALAYNPKLKDGKPQARSNVYISSGSKLLFSELDQPLTSAGPSIAARIGQIVLSNVPPGHYLLTVVITDPLADKNAQTQARTVDFTVK